MKHRALLLLLLVFILLSACIEAMISIKDSESNPAGSGNSNSSKGSKAKKNRPKKPSVFSESYEVLGDPSSKSSGYSQPNAQRKNTILVSEEYLPEGNLAMDESFVISKKEEEQSSSGKEEKEEKKKKKEKEKKEQEGSKSADDEMSSENLEHNVDHRPLEQKKAPTKEQKSRQLHEERDYSKRRSWRTRRNSVADSKGFVLERKPRETPIVPKAKEEEMDQQLQKERDPNILKMQENELSDSYEPETPLFHESGSRKEEESFSSSQEALSEEEKEEQEDSNDEEKKEEKEQEGSKSADDEMSSENLEHNVDHRPLGQKKAPTKERKSRQLHTKHDYPKRRLWRMQYNLIADSKGFVREPKPRKTSIVRKAKEDRERLYRKKTMDQQLQRKRDAKRLQMQENELSHSYEPETPLFHESGSRQEEENFSSSQEALNGEEEKEEQEGSNDEEAQESSNDEEAQESSNEKVQESSNEKVNKQSVAPKTLKIFGKTGVLIFIATACVYALSYFKLIDIGALNFSFF